MNFNADLYQNLKDALKKAKCSVKQNVSAVGDVNNDENVDERSTEECKLDLEENDTIDDDAFFSRLDELQQTVIDLFNKYNLKYTTLKSVEFAVGQCRDEYLSISAAQLQKIRTLQQYKDCIEDDTQKESQNIEQRLSAARERHENEMKQMKHKYEKTMKRMVEKTKSETREELEKEFETNVKARARKTMSQMRDGQQQKIKGLERKMVQMQSEIQQLQSDKNLVETKKELQIEQLKSQLTDAKQQCSGNKQNFDLLLKQCQNELITLKAQHQEVDMEHKERINKDAQVINDLRKQLTLKHEEFDALKSQLRQQIQELNLSMDEIEKEHESKMLFKQKEHEAVMEECQQRMQSVLDKKNAQIHRLKRLLEKTVSDYEKEKQTHQSMLNTQNQRLQQLTSELQI